MTTSNMGKEGFIWFLGIVEDLADPLQLGRCRVRVFVEHDNNILTKDLQWAITMLPTTSAAVKGIGASPTGLEIGSYVFGFYIDGLEKQYPAILATWPKIPDMDESKHDVSVLARAKKPAQRSKIGPEPDSAYAAVYPYNKVYQTASGHIVEFDDTSGQERINIYHKSGTYVEINKEGRMVTKVMGDNYQIVVKDNNVYVKGNVNITVEGNETVLVKGNCNITVDGNASINGKKSVSVTSSGPISVKGSSIKLN